MFLGALDVVRFRGNASDPLVACDDRFQNCAINDFRFIQNQFSYAKCINFVNQSTSQSQSDTIHPPSRPISISCKMQSTSDKWETQSVSGSRKKYKNR